MVKRILLLLVLVTFCFSQSQDFIADFVLTRPTMSGTLNGVLYYSITNKAIRYTYTTTNAADAYEELTKYDLASVKDQFIFRKCTGKCDIVALDPNTVQPVMYYTSADTCSATASVTTTQGRTCFPCTKTSGTITGICVTQKTSYDPARITFADGTVLDITIRAGAVPTAANFDQNAMGWGCTLNCGSAIDICFLIDESGSISGNYIPGKQDDGEWKQIRNFANLFVAGFTINPNQVNMGLVQFGLNARNVLPTLISSQDQYRNVISGLSKCTSAGVCNTNQPTYTGCGMINCFNLLQDTSGARALRANVPKLIVIVTDGNNNQPTNPFSWVGRSWKDPTDWLNMIAASPVKVVAVGVGDDIDQNFLNTLASTGPDGKELVLQAATFDILSSKDLVDKLGKAVCTAAGAAASPCPSCQGLCTCGACVCPSSCDDGNVCTDGACSSTANNKGGCIFTPKNCNDNNACTTDSCSTTTGCVYANVTCPAPDLCNTVRCDTASGCVYTPITCDDKNACTKDTCNPSTGCVYTTISCDDSIPCTTDTCNPATGCNHERKTCDQGNKCLVSSCVEATGLCTNPKDICQTPNPCVVLVNGSCTNTTCQFTPRNCSTNKCILSDCDVNSTSTNGCLNKTNTCDDGNACTADTCDPVTGCANTLISCDDSNACTVDSCNSTTGCVHTPLNCDDKNFCTDDTCAPATGCVYTPHNCSDGNGCTDDTCIPATGCNHTLFDVVDRCNPTRDVCLNVSCVPATGCVKNNVTCVSTYNDSCIVAVCVAIQGCVDQPRDCGPGDKCHVTFCNSSDGGCVSMETDECKLAAIFGPTLGAVLGAGAIAAIAIAAFICAGGSSVAAYVGYTKLANADFENKSPIYEPETQRLENPAYNRNSVFNQPPVGNA